MAATGYNGDMIETTRPLASDLWATIPVPDQPSLLEQVATLRLENAALRAENAVLQARIHELEARLGQNSSNSSRPPSSDSPQARRKRPVDPSGRKRGGQPGHRGAFRALLPVEQVDEVVAVVPGAAGIATSRFLNPLAPVKAESGGTRSWSFCRWPCG